jgi:hypothetical protein
MRLVYLVGIPGAGKSSVLRAALQTYVGPLVKQPFAHHPLLLPEAVAHLPTLLGRYDAEAEPFTGTDRLSMGVQTVVLRWCMMYQPSLVIGEGDRLGTDRFFSQMRDTLGYQCDVVHIICQSHDAAERRAKRHPIPQNETWIKGRFTKMINLDKTWVNHRIVNADFDAAVNALRALLSIT